MKTSNHAGRALVQAALLMVALCSSAAALASVDTSARPGGVYKLKPGVYVAEQSRCEDPANAAIRQYDGRGIASAHSRACTARVRKHVGQRYTVEQSCLDGGAGHGRRYVERQQVIVRDALNFSQTIAGETSNYRYCPAYQLPKDLQKSLR
ncbi:MAG: hypothetical protein ACJ8HI_20385 [Massilia sp.]